MGQGEGHGGKDAGEEGGKDAGADRGKDAGEEEGRMLELTEGKMLERRGDIRGETPRLKNLPLFPASR